MKTITENLDEAYHDAKVSQYVDEIILKAKRLKERLEKK